MNPLVELCTTAIQFAQAKRDATEQSYWEYGMTNMDQEIDELDASFQADFDKVLRLGNAVAHMLNHPTMPDKVYLIDADNGEDYEDYHHWIEKVFLSKAEAEDYLVSQGWEEPESDSKFSRLQFWHKHEEAYGWPVVRSAQILEHDIGAGV